MNAEWEEEKKEGKSDEECERRGACLSESESVPEFFFGFQPNCD